jgi:hypothetical protein
LISLANRKRPPTNAEEFLALPIPDRERKVAVEPVERRCAPFLERGEEHLGVTRCVEARTTRAQLFSQLDMVVDLAVVNDPEAAVCARHRLAASGGQVEDRATAVAEDDRRIHEQSGVVGASMEECVRHERNTLLGRG